MCDKDVDLHPPSVVGYGMLLSEWGNSPMVPTFYTND